MTRDDPTRFDFVSFLSDYGRADEFVGVCHAVLLDIAPHVRIVDVAHDVAPFDVRAGALTLVRAVQYLPPCVVLAVVDPGVGTARRCVAVEAGRGVLVGPDNGLLAPAVAMLGGAAVAVALENPELRLASPGPTFAGRDVMAPAAAHLANGVPLDEFGEVLDPSSLQPGLLPVAQVEAGQVRAEVLWVDRFGNCQLNVDPDELAALGAGPGAALEVRVRDDVRRARWVGAYADAQPGELVALVDSYGMLSLALDRAAAADALGLHAGTAVTVTPGPPGAGDRTVALRIGRTT